MVIKNHNEARYKSFIGRLFILRKHKIIYGYPHIPNSNRTKYLATDFGNVVFVLDETYSLARVTNKTGKPIWIRKFLLHKEITNKASDTAGTISNIINEVLSINTIIEKNIQTPNKDELKNVYQKLKNLTTTIRQFGDGKI